MPKSICKKTDMRRLFCILRGRLIQDAGDALALLKKQGNIMLSMIAQIAGAAYATVFGQILVAVIIGLHAAGN